MRLGAPAPDAHTAFTWATALLGVVQHCPAAHHGGALAEELQLMARVMVREPESCNWV